MVKSFGRDFFIYGISSSISTFIGIFLVPLYTRYFTTDDYGTMDLIATVVAFTAIIGMMQLESAVSRYYYAEKNTKQRNTMVSTALWSILTGSLLLFLILTILARDISLLLFDSKVFATVLIIAGITIPLSNLKGLFTVVMRFKKKPVHYLIFQLVQLLITISITVFLILYFRVGIISVFIGQLSGLLVIIACMAYYLRSEVMLCWSKADFKKMMRYSLPLVPSTAGNWANSYLNRFVMLGYLSVSEIGIYAVALKFASIFNLIGSAFRMAWGPFFWETLEKNPNHKNVFKDLLQHVSLLVFSSVILVTLYSNELVRLLTTEEYFFAAKLIGTLALAMAIGNVIAQIPGMGPSIIKKTEYNTIIYFISVAANIGSLFIFVPIIGLMGVPISLLIGNLTLFVIAWYNSERLYRIGFNKRSMFISIIIVIGIISLNYWFNIYLLIKLIISLLLMVYIYYKYQSSISILFFHKNKK